ncbi:MAG: DUF4357 domain-containing protein, partial [Methylobacter sp.]
EIQNDKTPTRSSISEADQAEMEEFIEYIKMLINTMGFKVFEPLVKEDTEVNMEAELLYIKAARGANGKGSRVSDGFVVFKGSEVASDTAPSFPKSFNTLREELLENEIIKEVDGKLVFQNDYLFSSPSTAAAVVMGRSANGLIEWKDAGGRDLKSIEAKEIQKANIQLNMDSGSATLTLVN